MVKYSLFNAKRIGFSNLLEDNEAIEDIFRKEFSSSFAKILFFCILWGGLAGVVWYIFRFTSFWPIVEGVLLLFAVYKSLFIFFKWYFNAILMTTENLLIVEWKNFLHKKSSRIDYWNLDSIDVVRIGMRAFMGNYGDLYFMKYNGGILHTAKRMYAPQRMARRIEKYREEQVDAKNFTEESSLKELISGLVQSHVREKGQPERGERVVKRPLTGKTVELERKKKEPKKSFIKKVFHPDEMPIEVEKELDDEGGIEIDL